MTLKTRKLAVFVTCHRFWAEVAGAERVDARMSLKHAHKAEEGPREAPAGPT